MEEQKQATFEGWARVEVLGRQEHIGWTTTEAYGQAIMFRVDRPRIAGCEETLTRAEWIGDVYAQPGSVVKRADIEPASVLIGSGSIYRITPLDQATAMLAIQTSQRRALIPVRLVETPQLTASVPDDDDDDGDDEPAVSDEAPF